MTEFNITNSKIEQLNDQAAAEFFRKPPTKYTLVSSLSVPHLPARRIPIRGCVITTLKSRKHFPLSKMHQMMFERNTAISAHLNDSKYQVIAVNVEGRSIFEAVTHAMDGVNLLRGLWSLFSTYGSWTFSMGSPARKPIGVIHTGAIHTLHFPDGKPAEENLYWYDPRFIEDYPLYNKELTAAEKHRRWAMRKLAKLAHKHDVEDLLIRYASALDQSDSNLAFLEMWSMLEKITNTINYDDVVSRAVSIYADNDRQITRELLECPRFRRNQYVHGGESTQHSDQVAYLTTFFLDEHLLRLIRNEFKVSSVEEYAEYLALPSDLTILQKRHRHMSLAIRMHKRRRKADTSKRNDATPSS